MRALLAAACVLVLWAAPAQAASNACNFSVDDYWTSIEVTLTGTSTQTEVQPGDTVTLTGATASAVLPAYMAQLGYNASILLAGENVIPVKVWIALGATNTVERTQLIGPISVQARTTISTLPDGSFASATPITYAPPALPPTTWTAAGGDVVFSQAPAGSITTRLPIGPDDALRTIKGSTVILADIAPIRFSMDCQPGKGNDTGTGPVVAAPTAFATTPGPLNQTCVDAAGGQSFSKVTFSGPTLDYTAGQRFTLTGVRVAEVDSGTVKIRGAGTVEGTQTVTIARNTLADTTWTPSGTGPVTFTQAPGLGSLTHGDLRCVAGFLPGDDSVVDNPAPPVFATATIPPPPPPPPPPPGDDGGGTTPPVVQPTPTPTPTARPKVGTVRVKSTRVALKRGKVKLQLACSTAAPCTGKLKLGSAAARRYSIAAGRSKTYTLTLKGKAKRVKVTLTPQTGKRITKTLAVKRS